MDEALVKIRLALRNSGLKQIETTLQAIEQELINSRLNLIEILVLEGRYRELKAAKWLVDQVLYPQKVVSDKTVNSKSKNNSKSNPNNNPKSDEVISSNISQSPWEKLSQAVLLSIELSLKNQTSTPLEIDILKEDKKRQLLQIILQEFELLLGELQKSQLSTEQLAEKIPLVLNDLWRSATTKFLGKYYTLYSNDQPVEVVSILLKEQKIVEEAILSKIPFVFDLYNYLLFKSALMINNNLYEFNTPEAISRAEEILNNLLIQVANAVMQPLLNNFADVEEIKQKFYNYHLIATREVEKFRNDLSWHYRLESWWGEAQAIYGSQYHLFNFTESGINKVDIYAPRGRELAQLTGVSLLVTLLLEFQDAVTPRLRTLTKFIGTALVYVLKNILGRGIGLIGKGILQGIGDSLTINKVRRRSERLAPKPCVRDRSA